MGHEVLWSLSSMEEVPGQHFGFHIFLVPLLEIRTNRPNQEKTIAM